MNRWLGIYGNAKEAAMHPVYCVESEGKALSGTERYTLHFVADQNLPVHAFWSLLMHD